MAQHPVEGLRQTTEVGKAQWCMPPTAVSYLMEDICSLLKHSLESTYLTFRDKIYQQVHGAAMGSPVLVVVANLVIEDIKQKAL